MIAPIDGDSEQQQVLRTWYDGLAGWDEVWDDLRRQVSAGMFVDLWRLTTRPD